MLIGLFAMLAIASFAFLFLVAPADSGQLVGGIISAAIGALGAIGIALWQTADERKRLREHAKALIIESDLSNLHAAILSPLLLLKPDRLADGRISTSFIRGIIKPRPLKRHRDPRFDVLFEPSLVQQMEQLEYAVDKYLELLHSASSGDPIPDDLQRSLWAQLDYIRVQTAETMLRLGGKSLSAEQLKAFKVYDYAPFPGKPFDGTGNVRLMQLLNTVADNFPPADQ